MYRLTNAPSVWPTASSAGRLACMAALALAASQPARAVVFWDEVPLYLTSATYSLGCSVDTTFYFGSKPAVDLSSFDFALSWDNALAAPVACGSGSLADRTASLNSKGAASYRFASSQVIQSSWTAAPLGGSSSFISTSYSDLKWAVFCFDTSRTLNQPIVVSMELSNIRDSDDDVMDTGSGFIYWATMTPVPEPAAWLTFICGLATATARRRAMAA